MSQEKEREAERDDLEDQLRLKTQALEQAHAELERQARSHEDDRLASVGALAGGVAHEINNPLTYVSGNLEYIHSRLRELSRSYADQRIADLVEVVAEARHGADRVRDIVRDLKIFSGAEEEEAQAPVAIADCLELALSACSGDIRERARLVKAYGTTPLVETGPKRLARAFLNLLSNAAQALPFDRIERNEVRVTTYTDDRGDAVVEICDNGCGIASENVGLIFDPFFTTKPVGSGIGLGLSVAHGIIEGIGGRISVESVLEAGTVFRVVLPAAKPGPINR